jgi:hypothetical protein
MKQDLDLIISALEAEKRSLQKMMKNSISEYDYLIAYYHSEALIQLNNRLSILHSFKDPFYNQREELKRQKKYLRQKPEYIKDKRLWDSIKTRHLKEIEKRVSELESQESIIIPFHDNQEIDDMLFALIEGKMSGFQIAINLYEEIIIAFTVNNNFLLITINMYSPDDPDFVYDNRLPNPLQGLGFEFDENSNAFVYRYNLTSFKEALDIKILLARLFYDVFHIREQITIKYFPI